MNKSIQNFRPTKLDQFAMDRNSNAELLKTEFRIDQ